jgi:hypothetical protein
MKPQSEKSKSERKAEKQIKRTEKTIAKLKNRFGIPPIDNTGFWSCVEKSAKHIESVKTVKSDKRETVERMASDASDFAGDFTGDCASKSELEQLTKLFGVHNVRETNTDAFQDVINPLISREFSSASVSKPQPLHGSRRDSKKDVEDNRKILELLKEEGFYIPECIPDDVFASFEWPIPETLSDVVTQKMEFSDLSEKNQRRVIQVLGHDIALKGKLENVMGDGKCGIYSVFAYLVKMFPKFGKIKYADIMIHLNDIMIEDPNPTVIDSYSVFRLVRKLFQNIEVKELFKAKGVPNIDLDTFSFMVIPLNQIGQSAPFTHSFGNPPNPENTICILFSGAHFMPFYFERDMREEIFIRHLVSNFNTVNENDFKVTKP